MVYLIYSRSNLYILNCRLCLIHSTLGLGDRTYDKLPCTELLFGMQLFVGLSVYEVCEIFCESANLLVTLVSSFV